MISLKRVCLTFVTSCILLYAAHGQSIPEGFVVVDLGGSSPKMRSVTAFAFAPDGRIFVTLQDGYVRIFKNEILLEEPFLKVEAEESHERGLTGIAFDPEFTTNHYIYLNYTKTEDGVTRNRIVRVTADGDHVVPDSEVVILYLDPVDWPNHVAGAMVFGLDGKLYVSTGDNVNPVNSQNLDTYHGKVLRINKDGSAPEDNPFPTGSEQRKRIWAYGLRNPFSMGFHPVTGKLYANDVGQSQAEEINEIMAGRNFGWPGTEGETTEPGHTAPVFTYHHTETTPNGCAVVGGDFLPAGVTNYPEEYHEKYFFVDLCKNWLYYLDPSEPTEAPVLFASTIGVQKLYLTAGPDGNFYWLSTTTSKLHKLIYSTTGEPIITSQPATKLGVKGAPVTFTVSVSGQGPISYQWMKDGVNIDGAVASTYTIAKQDFDDAGGYSVKVSNNVGNATSTEAKLTVIEDDPPTANILLPTGAELYVAGNSIELKGEGTDETDGTLPESAYQWFVNFHHDEHSHDQPPVTGSSYTFEIPVRNETSSNVWYRFILQVTDAFGLYALDSVDVYPVVSQLTFNSNPPGAQFTLDGQPKNTPYVITGVAGIQRDLHAIEPQAIDGTLYVFESWSQGGEALQTIVTPEVDTEYIATFSAILGLEDFKSAAVYPTPARSEVFVPWMAGENVPEIQLRDMAGRNNTVPVSRASNELILDVRSLSPGLYILSCVGSGRKLTAKVAIAR